MFGQKLLFIFLVLLGLEGFSIGVLVDQCVFRTPDGRPYIEIYMSINQNTIKADATGKKSVKVDLFIVQDSIITSFDKYNLYAPKGEDSILNFIDQKRFFLKEGTAELEVRIVDMNDTANYVYLVKKITPVSINDNQVYISDISLIESYSQSKHKNILSKAGYDMIPYPINFYPTEQNKLIFYAEVYNTKKTINDDFLIQYSLNKNNSNTTIEGLSKFSKQKSQDINIVFSEFDISNISSGNYELNIDVRSKQNELLANKKLLIQRSNKNIQEEISNLELELSFVHKMSIDSLSYYMKALEPIVSETKKKHIDLLLYNNDSIPIKRFFLSFWQSKSITDPERKWLEYKQMVDHVNEVYQTPLSEGYKSDRGFAYLKYGKPDYTFNSVWDNRIRPYEIWIYNYIEQTGQNNVKFVFSTNNSVTNIFDQVYSEAIGENSDPGWLGHIRKLKGREDSDDKSYNGFAVVRNNNRNLYPTDKRFAEIINR